MTTIRGFLLPHPPIIVEGIGDNEKYMAIKTIENMKAIGNLITGLKPDTIIVITPHGPIFQDAITINMFEKLQGNLNNFGLKKHFTYVNNLDLANKITKRAEEHNITIARLDNYLVKNYKVPAALDHGVIVPLSFINNNDFKLIHISIGLLPYKELYRFGLIMAEEINQGKKPVIIIASGDLSHKLTSDAPAGYHPMGPKFDEQLMDGLKNYDPIRLLTFDNELIERAGECGYRPLCILMGAYEGKKVKTKVYSYEGPYGVGYGIVEFQTSGESAQPILEKLNKIEDDNMMNIRKNESKFVSLARKALETYIIKGEILKPTGEINEKPKGVFVSIKKDGKLRGCIGTIEGTTKSLEEEIINNAINAGTKDPRFFPVEKDELNKLVYSVDILGYPEEVKSIDQLDPKKYGVIISKGGKKGLLLPDLEGIDTIQQQLSIAMEKAGIPPGEKVKIERFEVHRFK